jgi:class 3 adenylate cyclase/tetratricopeptide (TPR) repeat protein
MDVAEWLRVLDLEPYAPAFRKNDIDGELLADLTAEDLKELGIKSVGRRRRLLAAIAALRAGTASTGEGPKALAAAPPQTPATPEAERRQVTVMFCDLVGSTGLSARLDPEDLREVIGRYHACAAQTMSRFDGFVAKYMGDGVLIYFGYPQAHEDAAAQAVRAGLALADAVGELQAPRRLQVRIGIATGLVVVGNLIGAGSAQEQAIVGETPNLAARLQALAEPGAVVIAAGTRRLLGGLFAYRELGPISLKGIAEPVSAWQVLRPSAEESRFEARQERGMLPLLGREEELALLLRRWRQAQAGEGRVVLLTGEPGIGKSRIARALQDRLADESHTRLSYFCSPHHQDSALHPIIAQLERAAGFERDDAPEARLIKLEALLAQSSATEEETALIAGLLSLAAGERYRLPEMSPQRRKEKTLEALLAQTDRLSAKQPVLMIYEDVHWIDPTSLELLILSIERWRHLPVLLVATARPEFTPPWPAHAHATAIALTRLDPRESAALVQRVTGGKALPAEVLEQILARTDGVPLFVEELTKTVLESGLLREEAGGYVLTVPLPALAIPTTLHDSLMARLDRLASVREVAQTGAALGRQFSHALIGAVAAMPSRQLDDALEQLVGAELIYRRGVPPDAEYTFKHALEQEAAYGTLLRSRRQQLHTRIATTLERQFPEIVATQPELLAQHYTEAGLIQKAIECWLAAGQKSLARSMMAEAVALLRKGLLLLPDVADSAWRQQRELDLQITLGQALGSTHSYSAPEVDQAYGRAWDLCEQLGRPAQIVPILNGQFMGHLNRADLEWVRQRGEEACQRGEASHSVVLQHLGTRMCGAQLSYMGEFVTARAYLERSLALCASEDPSIDAVFPSEGPKGGVLFNLCRTLCCLGYLDQAHLRCEELIAEARRRPPFAVFLGLYTSCMINWCLQLAPSSLLQQAEEFLEVSVKQGVAQGRVHGAMYRGWCLAALGRADEGIPLLEGALGEIGELGITVLVPTSLTLLADAYGAAGRADTGLEQLNEALQFGRQKQVRWLEPKTLQLRGDLLLSAGNRSGAEASYREALALAQRENAKLWELHAATSLARLWHEQGKRTEAHALLVPVYSWFTEGFDAAVLKKAKALLQDLAAERVQGA